MNFLKISIPSAPTPDKRQIPLPPSPPDERRKGEFINFREKKNRYKLFSPPTRQTKDTPHPRQKIKRRIYLLIFEKIRYQLFLTTTPPPPRQKANLLNLKLPDLKSDINYFNPPRTNGKKTKRLMYN